MRTWIEWRERKAATTRGSGCKRPNGSYFWAFRRNGKRHETGGTRRKCVGEVTGMVSRGRCASRRSAPGAPGVWEQEPKGQGKLQNLYEGKNNSSGGGSVSRLPLVGPESCWENGRLRSTQSTQIRRPGGGSTRSLLQAHPSIRKCYRRIRLGKAAWKRRHLPGIPRRAVTLQATVRRRRAPSAAPFIEVRGLPTGGKRHPQVSVI